jgi:SOS-response transcriptional repressor LexA
MVWIADMYFGGLSGLADALGKGKTSLYSYKYKPTGVGATLLSELESLGISSSWIKTGEGPTFTSLSALDKLEQERPPSSASRHATEKAWLHHAGKILFNDLVVPQKAITSYFSRMVGNDVDSAQPDVRESDRWSHEIAKVTRDRDEIEDVRIPLYWQSVPAGQMAPIVTEEVDEFNVSQRYRNTFAVYIRGDSLLEAGIEDGDIAVFRVADVARDGDLAFACVNGLCTLKIYRDTPTGIVLEPANKNYEAIQVGSEDNLSIRGILMNIIRKPRRQIK